MRVSRHQIRLLYILLLILLAIPITARADDDEQDDDYDVKARVVRVSLLGGEVNLKRNDNKDWEPIKLNYPLVEGDTIATKQDSNLEIQVDARNFIRLAANSVLRIITLRDEGIAISVVEGTMTVRLAKFDRNKNGYFEIDAPRTTMAAEKDGLYRIDVPQDGRVRLTVRDGGIARIYSDTSGFTLRDGRSAELVVTGENAGDWEFVAAAPSDAIDAWVSDRERNLAQRLKYDVKYFDESVWGAEDLEAYGDWNHTDEFGWIWRPHASVISSYNDWAPYRYGHWTWVPPYGWTWIGDEPFGWAPYHYGRWVYYNNYWAWAPRSVYVRKRSWWRPALVAFNFSFGNDICWYPLSYYQRDPHSRHYRRDHRYRDRDRDRGPGYGRRGDGRRDGRHDYGEPRGVTRVPRRDFGNPERRGERVDEPVARRIVDLDPERGDGDLPHRERRGRGRTIEIPERRTGAAERAPGAALDDELRRSRVFRGRETRPREREVTQPGATTPITTPATNAETPPTGAVARPEPRPRRDREPRTEPPGTPDQPRRYERPDASERRERRQERNETAPTAAPEPRSEQPAPAPEPRRETPREAPRENPRPERRERESAPESRPRPEPRSEPRSESPRSESPRYEAPRSESPRSEAPRSDPPRSESPRSESPRSEPPRSESPRPAPDRPDRPNN